MKTLNNIELQIISKYIYNFKDMTEFLKLNKDLKYLYYSTFDIINIPYNHVLTNNEIKNIINKLNLLFPNLKTIILNFYNDVKNYIYSYEFTNYILRNYRKFDENVKLNNYSIIIKIQFDFKIYNLKSYGLFINRKYEDEKYYNYNIKFINELYKLLNKDVIINTFYFAITIDFKFIDYFELFKTCKYQKLKFVFSENKCHFTFFIVHDNNGLHNYLKDLHKIIKENKHVKNIYYKFSDCDIIFNAEEFLETNTTNIYKLCYINKNKYKFLEYIGLFELFYEIMKHKNYYKEFLSNNKYIDNISFKIYGKKGIYKEYLKILCRYNNYIKISDNMYLHRYYKNIIPINDLYFNNKYVTIHEENFIDKYILMIDELKKCFKMCD